jgi:hypothetical protein
LTRRENDVWAPKGIVNTSSDKCPDQVIIQCTRTDAHRPSLGVFGCDDREATPEGRVSRGILSIHGLCFEG